MKHKDVKITVILTCFNRKDKTINCINKLINNRAIIDFIVIDDNSSDGTAEVLTTIKSVEVFKGTGNLYWSRGMHVGIEKYLNRENKSDYVMLVNDDVDFKAGIVDRMVQFNNESTEVLVGATCGSNGEFTYGGMKLNVPCKKDIYHHVMIDDDLECDTFNCNCVLFPDEIIRKIGNFDSHYTHSLADIDYGFMVKRGGFMIKTTNFYVGICNTNSTVGTWKDNSLSRIQRIRKKESVKGAPFKEWFYFLNKNFGIFYALKYSITPYLKILMGR